MLLSISIAFVLCQEPALQPTQLAWADFTGSDLPDLVAVHPDGFAQNLCYGLLRARYRNGWDSPELMTPGEAYEFVFELYPTSNVFRKGHRVRLDISSSNWPRFDVNPNTGGPLGRDRAYKIATQTIYHAADRASHIVLPLQGS